LYCSDVNESPAPVERRLNATKGDCTLETNEVTSKDAVWLK